MAMFVDSCERLAFWGCHVPLAVHLKSLGSSTYQGVLSINL